MVGSGGAVGRVRDGDNGDCVLLSGGDIGGAVRGALRLVLRLILGLVLGLVLRLVVVDGLVVDILDARAASLGGRTSTSLGTVAGNGDKDGGSRNSDSLLGNGDGDGGSILAGLSRLSGLGSVGALGLLNSDGAGQGRGGSGRGGGLLGAVGLGAGDDNGLLDGLANDGRDDRAATRATHGDGDGLLVDLVSGDGGQAAGGGGRSSSGGGDGSASDLASAVVRDDGRGNLAGLGDGADGLGQLDGVGDNVGDTVGLGDGGHARLASRAVSDGGSTADDSVNLSVNDSQGGLAVSGSGSGSVATREVHVVAGGHGVGNRGQDSDGGNSGLHFDGLSRWQRNSCICDLKWKSVKRLGCRKSISKCKSKEARGSKSWQIQQAHVGCVRKRMKKTKAIHTEMIRYVERDF